MEIRKLQQFLLRLGYSGASLHQVGEDRFSYVLGVDKSGKIDLSEKICVDFFYFNELKKLSEKHLEVWNQNNRTSFIAVFDDKTYVIDSRHKPNFENPFSNQVVIESFDYGINSPQVDAEKLKLISKEGLDSGYYFNFIIEHQKKKRASEVDKDLLLNLLALRRDLVTKENEKLIHLLLLRCLFLKYLEDREVFAKNHLLDALEAQSPEKLITAFKKVKKINGDLFKNDELRAEDLIPKYLKKLSEFFGYYDYKNKQGRLFPYQFDKIPIQLISNIYESFLKEETKKDQGIYYTPGILVDFMLSRSLAPVLENNKKATVLDPACGSGTFLVEAFRMIVKENKAERSYDKKVTILKNQLFGIDLDERALQIAAFSLYLALLEGEKKEFIQEKIKTESPILPSLLGKNLIRGNALTDDISLETADGKTKLKFDCIVANPPWGSVAEGTDPENIKIRKAIGNKNVSSAMSVYKSVSDFQRSQAFLLRASEWANQDTRIAMVVNSSIFMNENGVEFRKDLINNYHLQSFFELSNINPILFKKRTIGKIKEHSVEIGANEPCCVLVYSIKGKTKSKLKYITPKLNRFTEYLRIIAYASRDVKEVEQDDLLNEDMLWRIFVNGGWEDYQIIKKRILNRDKRIQMECRRGFTPEKNMKSLGDPVQVPLIDLKDFNRYHQYTQNLPTFNMNQKLARRRDESIFKGQRIVIPTRLLGSHVSRFSGVILKDYIVHKQNIHAIKIRKNGQYVNDYGPYLAILNSKFIGYSFYAISAQWGKGGGKHNSIRNSDAEKIPFPQFDESDSLVKKLSELINLIEKEENQEMFNKLENEIDQIVFKLYKLTDYEQQVVNEFYDTHYYKKDEYVNDNDIRKYAEQFTEVFSLMLSDRAKVSARYDISMQLGAYVSFTISDKYVPTEREHDMFFKLIKQTQAKNSHLSSLLEEEKVKYYDKENKRFYIIKSNQFRDWTERQAIDDANEEIGDIIKHLKKK